MVGALAPGAVCKLRRGLPARLRRPRYDLVLDLQGQLRSAVFALATGAPVRIGFDRPRAGAWHASSRTFPEKARKHAWQGAREGSWLAYTHKIPVPTLDVHAVDRYLGVGPMLGFDDGAADFSFPIPQEASGRIDALLDYYDIAKSELVAMAPGTIWETKQWRSDRFAEVARHFLQKHFAVTLIGSDRERTMCEDVAELAPGAVNLAGETTLTRACRADPPRDDLCDQQFRPDASCRRARPSGRQRIRADRSGMGWPLPTRRRGLAGRSALLALLFARTQPLHAWSCLHEQRRPGRGDCARESVIGKRTKIRATPKAQAAAEVKKLLAPRVASQAFM